MNTEIKPNRIEENLINHWECLIEGYEGDPVDDEDRDRIHAEVELFLEHILPTEPTEGWAFWTGTDHYEFLTASEELADRLADIIDTFADAHTGYYDPEEDSKSNEIRPDTGYWYVDWD